MIVFGGDQTYSDPGFSHFAADADLLVMHAMLTDKARGNALTQSVGLPDVLGSRAQEAKAKRVVLSHLMQAPAGSTDASLWSLSDLDSVKGAIAKIYLGRIDVAQDGSCYPLRKLNRAA